MCLQLGRSSVQTTWLPVVVWNPHPQRVQTRPDDKILDKIEQKKGKRKKGKEEKITESVPSFSQSKTRTGGCFVKMISQRSVKVKHKAEVKDKHNSCVLSASGDEPNLTSRTAAWQPEINAHVPLPLEWCASDFFFLKIWSYSRFFFLGTTLPWVLVDVFGESSLRQKTFAHSGGSTAMKTSGNQPPGFRLSRRQRVPAHHRVLWCAGSTE